MSCAIHLQESTDHVDREILSGWGLVPSSTTSVVQIEALSDHLALAKKETVIARGLGRGYGDCAVSGRGITVLTDSSGRLKIEDGVLEASSGVSIDEVLRFCVPLGYFIPVTPGTKFVTIGGAIAADVHGKNHHKDGSFGSFVIELELMIADGSIQRISPSSNSRLFWATVGGMGLTGVILKAKVQLPAVKTSRILGTNIVCKNLEELMNEMVRADDYAKYSVAWVDTLARGKKLGRSILSIGDHAAETDLGKQLRKDPLQYSSKQLISFPRVAFSGFINRFTVRVFNALWFYKAKFTKKRKLVSFDGFFYPLDGVRDWNRVYGSAGFIQYQFSVPDEASHLVKLILEKLAEHKIPSFLSVLKRFGPQGEGLLSFPSKGWTLAVDIPTGVDGLGELLDELDENVVTAGGRLYFAKDSRMNPRHVEKMYPKLEEFREVKREVDAENVFQSNLSRRLGL
jgi:decaprenylphospho-beta-D-ribofuranose 2-oxidase